MRLIGCALLVLIAACRAHEGPQPIIDMHRHAPLASAFEADAGPEPMLAELERHNVVLSILSITSPSQAELWGERTQDRIILGAMMPCPQNLAGRYDCFPETGGLPDLDWLRQSIDAGQIGAFHEMMFNYDGTPPDSPKMTPYWALAETSGLPVGVHTWSGPPPGRSIRANPNCCPDYDGEMGNPVRLRTILDRHPNLKIWLQHVGSDGNRNAELWDETLSLLADYPNVYIDLSITNAMLPIEAYENGLTRLISAGFADRIMLGTDNAPLAMILDRLSQIESLTDEQRSAILYDNAARFLNLDDKTRRQHRE